MNLDSEHESQLPWTGERYVPQLTGQIQLEHVHRYLLAREYAKERDVLDIASGEGYGSAILANTARSVIGVDIAAEAVRHASIRYKRDNVEFRHGSCAEIPLDNNSVDLVVSFETIEHLDEHKAMMAEIKRVLRPEGVLIISSPDKKEYSILLNYRNPFHVRELFKEEFEDLIRAYFKNLALLSQRIVYGSGILPESGAFPVIDYDIKDSSRSHPGLARPRYLIALASDAALPLLSCGLLEQPVEESENVKSYAELLEKRSGVTAQLEDKVRQLEEQLRSQSAQSGDKVRQLEEQLRSQSAQSGDKVRQLEEQLRSQSAQSGDKVRQLEEQLRSQSAQSGDKVRQLEEQLRSQSAQSGDKVRQLEEQLRSQSAQSGDKVRQLEEQFRSQSAQSGDKVRRLEEQLRSQSAQSAELVRQLEEEVASVNLARDGERRLCQSMTGSLSWRLTWPLRVLRNTVTTTIKKKGGNSHGTNRPSLKATLPDDPPVCVNSLYKAAFGRIADPEGLANRIHQLQSGVSLEVLAEELVDSPEFQTRHGSDQKVDIQYIAALYRDGLGREPDPEGLAHWLAAGTTRAKVLAALASSDEAIEKARASSSVNLSQRPLPDAESILMAGLFDERYYLEKNPSVASTGIAPFQHYRTIGWREGCDPNPLFDTRWYLENNPDVAKADAEPFRQYLRQGWKEGRSPHPMFDVQWYLERNPDVRAAGMEPLSHYIESGWKEGRSPHPLFDPKSYLERNPDVQAAGMEPLSHYIESGWKEGRSPHPLFDSKSYLERNPDVQAAGMEPLSHYIESGWKEGRSPHPLFDPKSYLERNPAVAASGIEPLQHYRTIGWREGCDPNPLFDTRWYLENNPDVVSLGLDPLEHYYKHGWRQGLSPSPHFDSAWYLKAYPDVAQAEMEPLTHYLKWGLVGGRLPNVESALKADLFDERYYLEKNPSVASTGIAPFQHYRTIGWREGCDPNPLFDTCWYLENNPDVVSLGLDPLEHYYKHGWRQGLSPSPHFDSAWYLKAYPDVAQAEMEPLTHYLKWGLVGGRFPRSLDRELSELPNRNLVKWIDECCTQFLSSSTGREFPEALRETVISNIRCALAALRIEDPPEVSIIVPVHNNVNFTLISVASVLMSAPRRSFELIVADDVSTDDTQSIFECLPKPIRYLRWNASHGFLKSCNAAARYTDPTYLVFLNNDTIVFPKWLDSLIDTLQKQPDAGLVGSKLLFASGRLQEAGGIIWNDASGMNFGGGDDPLRPEYNYLREVDYCSGCSLAIPKDLWTKLGGFDERFVPAYYEDADLCFRIRQSGMKVLYQPLSKLIHFEGVSSGTSTSSGVKAYQETNRPKFLDRWSSTLRHHGTWDDLPSVADRYSRGHILVVDSIVPTPDQDAGSLAAFNFLRILKQLNKQVTFVPADLRRNDPYASLLEEIGVECLCFPAVSTLQEAISHVCPEIEFAFLYRVSVAKSTIDLVRCHAPNAKIVFNTVDLHFLREKREADLTGGRWRQVRAENTKRDELEVIRKADATIVLNESERVLLNKLLPTATVYHIGLPIEIPSDNSITWDLRRDIVFVGGFSHSPNADAVLYFIREVWPILREQGYSDRFVIVGSNMPVEIKSLGTDHIIARGYVEDLAEAFVTARVSLAPLRFGAGLKGKVASSLGYGVPCVTTSIGVEGSGLLNGVNILVGDTPQDLASHILRVYNDRQLWTELSQNGLRFFGANYSIESVGAKFEQLMTALKTKKVSNLK